VFASIDVGTNTVRLLFAKVSAGKLVPVRYYRKITRLGGGYSTEKGLAPDAMERTLSSLHEIASLLKIAGIDQVHAVGTAALRSAVNGVEFTRTVLDATGIRIEVIDGEVEARLCARGVLAALAPCPERSLIFDIGGGSTEFLLVEGERTLFQCSYPLGVVTLSEKYPSLTDQCARIEEFIETICANLAACGLRDAAISPSTSLVGTAGTVTTLAAIHLGMTDYDWRRVNNLQLERSDLAAMLVHMQQLSNNAREQVPGMEKGRGDLIVPGLQIVLNLMHRLGKERMTVSDFGILEGTLLALAEEAATRGAGGCSD